jgi:hypothetical protein
MTTRELLWDDYLTWKRGGSSYWDWNGCSPEQLTNLEFRAPLTEAERDALANAKATITPEAPKWEARSKYRWEKTPTSMTVGVRMPSYASPGIICPAPEDAWLQARGRENACRSFEGGWLVSLEIGPMAAPGFEPIIGVYFRTEAGETGFLPPSGSHLPIENCDTFFNMRRYIPGGAPLDPHCTAFAHAHGWE